MRKLTKAEKAKRSKSIGVINGTYAKMKAARAKRSKSIGVLNGEMHKDVKSHNTKINVFSGTSLKFENIINKKFKYINDSNTYMISKNYISKEIYNGNFEYFANIIKITKNNIKVYNIIFGKKYLYTIYLNKIVLL